jgi:hypothetical protein
MSLKRPGLVFKAEPVTRVHTSNYGSKYETEPNLNDTYIVCQDGTIQARNDPEREIIWNLFEEENGWSYGYDKPLLVYFISWETDIPEGRGEESRNAYIIEFDDDDGEPEVSSC